MIAKTWANQGIKNVLLVEPNFPIPKKSINHKDFLPIGLLKMASYLKKEGFKVQLIRLDSNLQTKIDQFIIKQDSKCKPDLVLITSLFTYWSKYVKEAVNFSKIKFPNARIVVGGVYASLMPEHCKEFTGCDDVFVGVCEEAEKFYPDYSLVNVDYQIIHSSRGCIRKCDCCGVYEIEPSFKCKSSIKDEITTREKERQQQAKNLAIELSNISVKELTKDIESESSREILKIIQNGIKNEIYNDIKKITTYKKGKIIFYDNNLLANPNIKNILNELIQLKKNRLILNCESQSGFDGRILYKNPELGILLKKANFINPKIAWDGNFSDKDEIKRQIDILIDAGYKYKEISVFMLFNHDISFEEMEKKRIQCWKWNVQITDCRYRPLDQTYDNYNPYTHKPQSSKDYYIHPNWNDKLIRLFRSNIRKQNICVRQDIIYYSADIERKRISKEKATIYKKMTFTEASKYVKDAWDPSQMHYEIYKGKSSK